MSSILTKALNCICVDDLFDSLPNKHRFLIESSDPMNRSTNPVTLMGADPFLMLKSERQRRPVLQRLDDLLKDFNAPSLSFVIPNLALPPGLAVGFLAYDLCYNLDDFSHLKKNKKTGSFPELYLAFYDSFIVHDPISQNGWIISTGLPEQTEAGRSKRAKERMEEFVERINVSDEQESPARARLPQMMTESRRRERASHNNYNDRRSTNDDKESPARARLPQDFTIDDTWKGSVTKKDYFKSIGIIKEYIASGDIYQANFTQRFSKDVSISPVHFYRFLRETSPAPFSSFLDFGSFSIISSSPERFLKKEGGKIITQPIKGTRPRSLDKNLDDKLLKELEKSEKDRAELTMIIDLERNDLGRICKYGTVSATPPYSKTFATVHHLESTVTGTLKPNVSTADILSSCFPGGSITGAPKIRATEILSELEPVSRSVYTGAIGWFGFDGNFDLGMAIRTVYFMDGRAYFHVGGGIVADSESQSEYDECMTKASGILKAFLLASEQR